jgi:hypothetical protein
MLMFLEFMLESKINTVAMKKMLRECEKSVRNVK